MPLFLLLPLLHLCSLAVTVHAKKMQNAAILQLLNALAILANANANVVILANAILANANPSALTLANAKSNH